MKRHPQTINLLILVFIVWFLGTPVYCGYALLNEADFLAPLPQWENADSDIFTTAVKNYFSGTPPFITDVAYLQPDGFYYSSLEIGSTSRLTLVLRC